MTQPPAPARKENSGTTPISQLRKGSRIQGGVYLVQEANFKQTRNSKYFIQFVLRDRSGSIRAVRWEATQEIFDSFSREDFLRISGRVEEFQEQLQVIVDEFERVEPEGVRQEDFLPVSQRDLAEMERELLETVASVQDPHVKSLLTSIVEDPAIRPALVRCPAGKVLHHAYVGGLLEHVLSIIGAAKLLGRNYPSLNLDVLVAAAVLHDLGKIRELSYARSFNYTDEGQLVGHIAIGLLILAEKAGAIAGFPKEMLLHLQHIILSHHGLPEHGALKPPMTAEAVTFHYLDNLDAKLATIESLKRDVQIAGEISEKDRRWSEYQPSLGRRIFFPET